MFSHGGALSLQMHKKMMVMVTRLKNFKIVLLNKGGGGWGSSP